MKIKKLIICLFFMTGIYQSNYVFAAANCPQFANEINLKEFENKSLCYFYKKTTEHKCYKEEVNKRNILCYANTDNWSCKSGYRKSGEKCFKNAVTQQIPRNAHKVGTSWVCNTNYYRNNAKTGCLYVPANASSSYSSNIFKCNTGYSKSGNRCVRNSNTIKIPQNSHKVGTSWVCNTNYYRNNAKTACLYVPANSTSSYSSNYFKCNTGFSKSGNSCVKNITIPANSHKVGTSWVCNTNYYRNNAKTACLYVPLNSTSSYSSNDFKCNTGFSKSGSRCVKKATNNNLCPGSYSSSWTNCSGTYTSQNGNKYIGFFKNGNFNGQGTYTWTSGQKYVGGWKDDKRNGQGTQTWTGGQKYVGGWKDDDYNGQGTLTLASGKIQQGIFKNGEFQGLSISIPQNSHKFGTSWVCNTNYYRNNAKTGCLYVPANSTSSYSSNDFKCNGGFSKSGNSCVKIITIPQNSHKVGTSWVCNTNYYRNNTKTGCLYVPANSTSSYSSNDFKCNGGYQKKNSYSCISDIEVFKNWVFKNWIYIAIAIFILWLFTRKGDKKPKPPPQESPSHRAQPKPSPRPKPKPRRRKVKDPQTLLIEIGVAVAMADGNLSDIEGITINKWMKKMLDFHGNNEKLKKLFNDTLRDAISSAKTSSHDLRAICLQLNSQGTNKLKLDALTMAYEVMGADGHIHEKEAEMIHSIVTTLEIHSINQENIRDQFIIKTLIESDFNFINLLGMSISASKESKCKKLKEEFRKWNGRMNSLPSSKERKNVQKVLDLIGKARKDNNC